MLLPEERNILLRGATIHIVPLEPPDAGDVWNDLLHNVLLCVPIQHEQARRLSNIPRANRDIGIHGLGIGPLAL